MRIGEVILKTIDCIGCPYAILMLIGLLWLIRKNIILLVLLIGMGLWRSMSYIISSRYSAIFIIISAIIITTIVERAQKKTKSYSKLWLLFAATLVIYNVLETFYSFRNIFYYDIKEEISRSVKEKGIDLLSVAEKDYKRIKTNDMIPHYENSIESGDKLTNEYFDKMFWNKKVLFVVHEKNKTQSRKRHEMHSYGTVSFEHVGSFVTDKHAKRVYNLYSYDAFLPCPTKEISDYTKDGQLKIFNPETNIYIYQLNNKIVWAIGAENDLKKAIIYHLYTEQIDLLPENRKQYKFDNRDFHYKEADDKRLCKGYIVLEKEIPKEYPISKIVVGFAKKDNTLWLKTFMID